MNLNPTDNQYVSTTEVLNITGQVVTDDACKSATSIIETQNGIYYYPVTLTKTFEDIYSDYIDLHDYPITSITSLYLENGTTNFASLIRIKDQNEYPGIIVLDSGFANHLITITYNCGFNSPTYNVKSACAKIAVILTKQNYVVMEQAGQIRYMYSQKGDGGMDTLINEQLKLIPKLRIL